MAKKRKRATEAVPQAAVKMKARRVVEVVSFEDPMVRVRTSHAKAKLLKHKQGMASTTNEDPFSLKDASKDVYKLAVTGFDRKRKKLHDIAYIESLNGTVSFFVATADLMKLLST